MSGGHDLGVLLANLCPKMVDGVFVFASVDQMPKGITPRMMFHEAEGITLILAQDQAKAAGIAYVFPCRMITLNVHSALDAVGFLAHIIPKLAAAGMGVNPVAGVYHDHLFIPDGREDEALRILQDIATQAGVEWG